MNPFTTPILTGLLIGALIAAGLLVTWRGIHPAKPAAADVIRAAGQRYVSTPTGWREQTLLLASRTGDTDTLTASSTAYVNALNNLFARKEKSAPEPITLSGF